MTDLRHKKEYFFNDDTGDAYVEVYQLFPGVEVSFISIHMEHFDFSQIEKKFRRRYVGIHFCREGRIERELENEFFYLMPDDCSVTVQDDMEKKFRFPLKHYHGISIGIDTELSSGIFSSYIGKSTIDPSDMAKRLCGENHSVILRSVEALKNIFTESYAIAEQERVDYLKIKLLELLFVLGKTKTAKVQFRQYGIPRTQVEVVKHVASYISDHLNDKLSLKELTSIFGVSDTYLQKSFRAVYGMPVISFIRMQKMQKAAQELIHTDRSVDEIAEEFGYVNESKFSAAFKKMMGDSPSVFRKEHSKVKIL